MGILKVDPTQGEKKVLPKKPKSNSSNQVVSEFSDELFSNYTLTPEWEEAFLSATNPDQRIEDKPEDEMLNTPEHPMHDTLEETHIAEEQVMGPDHAMTDVAEPMVVEEDVWSLNVDEGDVWSINVDVSNESVAPPEASLIAENNNLDACWGIDTFQDQSSSIVDNLENIDYGIYGNFSDVDKVTEEESIYNMDLVQFAIGESGLDGLLAPKEEKDTSIVKTENTFSPMFNDQPVATTSSFLNTNELFTMAVPTTFHHILPNNDKGIMKKTSGGEGLKKRPGRPERKTPIKITEIPKVGLTGDKLKAAKYRRARDLNNEASKRCRQNRKEKQQTKERECQELAEKNRELTVKMHEMEAELEAMKANCRSIGYPC